MRLPSPWLLALLSLSPVVASDLAPVPAPADGRIAAARIEVAPDDPDWTYEPGTPVRFHIAVIADQHRLPGVTVSYTLGDEVSPSDLRTAQTPADGRLVIEAGTRNAPGFLRCIVTAEVGGRTYRGLATAGFAPDRIAPTQADPTDFDAFWSDAIAALAEVPLEPLLTHLPDASTDTVDVYHVSVRTLGGGNLKPRIHGILCEPKAPGKYPAILRVPGAGVRPYAGLVKLAAQGAITLEIGIHGIPVNLPQEVYDQLRAGALDGYWTFNLSAREHYYYRRVILGALRANDFLASRPAWDGKNLAVGGESQGGMLAIATTALDPRVTRLHAIVPAFCDVSGPLHGRPGGWPHLFQDSEAGYRTDANIRTLQYYDTLNFARRVKVPGIYAWGYNDEVCPPTSMFAAYHVITAPKRLVLALEMSHRTMREVYDAVDGWILGEFGLELPPAD